jgi:protein O-GlcNAc transferase
VRRAIDCNTGIPLYHSHLGHLLARTGQRCEAVAAFERVLEYEPENAGIHNVISSILSQSGQHERALSHIRRAVELDPGNRRFQAALSGLLVCRDRATGTTTET